MGLAKHKKLSKSEYDSLSVKDEDTLYAVNENGDFSEENLEDSAELYIGDKKMTPAIVGTTGQSTTAVMHQKAVTDAINELQSDIEAKSEDFYGECNISPSTVAKTVTTLNGGFVLKKGAKVSVKFLQGHTASTMTLNVDGTGAKNVYRDGNSPKSNMIKAYNVYEFIYDGTYWRIVGVDTDTTYSNATQSAAGLMPSTDKAKLDGMANNAGYEAYLQWGGRNRTDGYSPIDASMIPMLDSNRFNCYPVNKVNIEYSRDKGVTWVDYGATEEEKQALFKEDLNALIQVGGKGATPSIDNMVRITTDTASTLYAILRKFIIYVTNNSGGNDCYVTISGRTQQNYENDNDTWVVFADKAKVSGRSGWNVINVNTFVTYGNTKTTQYGQIRFTFGLDSLPTSQNIGLVVHKMSAYGEAYTAPNTLAWYSRPFSYNYDGSMVLPKGLEITGGNVKLANFNNAKIHGFPYSKAIGNYSIASGLYSFTGISTGDTTYPYAYITSISPLQFTIVDDNLYGVSLAKNDSTTYTYNGVDYTVTNPSSSYAASVFLVEDSDGLLVKGTSYPFNICSIVKSSVTIGNGRILAVKNIIDNIWEIIVNQNNNTIQEYTSSLNLYLLKKTASTNYSGNYSIACGYNSIASGFCSTARGGDSVAIGPYSVASGQGSIASGSVSFAVGTHSIASGSPSIACGQGSIAKGSHTIASGYYAEAIGSYSIASGVYAVASGTYSVALNRRTVAKGQSQTVVGQYNADDNNAYFIVGNGTSDIDRSNAMTVSKTGIVTAKTFKGSLQGNADTATKVNNALTIKKGSTTNTFDGSTAKTIDITDLQNIGDLNNLQTSNKSNLVDAINEVNTKANNNTGGTVNDSTISPFAGFLPDGATIINSSSSSTNGEVLYDSATNRFIWKDLSGTFVQYYANWGTSYLYNTTSDSSVSAKVDKLFSYNDKHYMVINGTLQDISALNDIASSTVSGIVKLSDSTTGNDYGSDRGVAATPKAVANVATASRNYATAQADNALNLAKNYSDNNLTTAENYSDNKASQTLESANQYTDSKATQSLTSANNYTDNQISAKIQLVTALPSNPISDVLYLIQET